MGRKKIVPKRQYTKEEDFIKSVARECINELNIKEKKYLMDNPCAISYHHTYGMDIRNRYIYHNPDLLFDAEPDELSNSIIEKILSELLPEEYEYGHHFIQCLYRDKRFLALRREYRRIYREYPAELVGKYKRMAWYRKADKTAPINNLVIELEELVRQEEDFKKTVEECGISYQDISEQVEYIKNSFLEGDSGIYVPLQVCLLPYKKKIGDDRYLAYRRRLMRLLDEEPKAAEYVPAACFQDKILAKSFLKHGWTLKYLPMYQNDDALVEYSLSCDGEAIQYAGEKYQKDEKWVRFAIEHSEKGTILSLDCMEPYRSRKEFARLACEINRQNLEYVDQAVRDELEANAEGGQQG